MKENRIEIKGDKEGISVIVDIDKFINFDEVISEIINVLSIGKGFYKNSIIKIIANLKNVSDSEIAKLKDKLFEEIHIRDCIFDDTNKRKIEENTLFTGIYEGRTKFIKRTIRGGQCINSKGNIVIIGDINSGAEVSYAGSHKLNHLLTKKLFENSEAYEILETEELQEAYEYALQNA